MIIFAMCLFGFFKGAGLLVTLTRGALKVIYLDLRVPNLLVIRFTASC